MKRLLETTEDIAPFIARVVLGITIFPHGAQKLLGMFGGYGFDGTMGFLTGTVGVPYILALLVIVAEFFGSLGLILGLLSRVSAFGVGCVMIGATFLGGHWANGFFMDWGGNMQGEGFEFHFLALGLALLVLIKGGGKLSADAKISEMME